MTIRLDDLELITLVADLRSFSRAAERLNRSQQTVSARVAAVEDWVGEPLFDRSSRGVTTTPAGMAFLGQALVSVDAFSAAVAQARTAGQLRLLRVAVHASTEAASGRFLSRALAGFNTEVEVVRSRSFTLIERLVDGDADLVLGPFNEVPESVAMHTFTSDPLVCVVPAGHRYAALGLFRLEDVARSLASVNVWGDGGEQLVLPACASAVDPEDRVIQVCALSSVAGPIAAGILEEITVVDLPRWSRELHVAFRADDAAQTPMRAVVCAVEEQSRAAGCPSPR